MNNKINTNGWILCLLFSSLHTWVPHLQLYFQRLLSWNLQYLNSMLLCQIQWRLHSDHDVLINNYHMKCIMIIEFIYGHVNESTYTGGPEWIRFKTHWLLNRLMTFETLLTFVDIVLRNSLGANTIVVIFFDRIYWPHKQHNVAKNVRLENDSIKWCVLLLEYFHIHRNSREASNKLLTI